MLWVETGRQKGNKKEASAALEACRIDTQATTWGEFVGPPSALADSIYTELSAGVNGDWRIYPRWDGTQIQIIDETRGRGGSME